MLRILSRRSISLMSVAVVIGLVITFALTRFAIYNLLDHEEDVFASDANLIRDLVSQRINATEEGIHGLVTLFNSSTYVDADQFRLFSEDLLRRHDFLQSALYIPLLNDEAREEFESQKQDEGYVTFSVRERRGNRMVAAPRRSHYFPILYQEPMDPAMVANIGFDMLSEVHFGPVISSAIDLSYAVASTPKPSSKDASTYMLFKATYAGMTIPTLIRERRRIVNGLLALEIDTTKLLANIPEDDHLEISLSQESATDGGRGALLVKHEGKEVVGTGEWLIMWLDTSNTIKLPGQIFELRIRRPLHWHNLNVGLIIAAVAIGAIFTLLLTVLAKSFMLRAAELQHRNREIEQLVTIKTRELAEEKDRAQVTLEAIGDGVIRTDVNGFIEYLNPVAERLTGWTVQEAINVPVARVFRTTNENTHERLENPVEVCLQKECIVTPSMNTVLINRKSEEIAIDDSAAPIHDQKGRIIGAVLVFHDVSQTRKMAQKMIHQATHDSLSGLPNRVLLMDRLEQVIVRAPWHHRFIAIMFLDLDRFKLVNDTLGHDVGDELLKHVAKLLNNCVRDGDTVSRLGGDEFVILCTDVASFQDVQELAGRIIRSFETPFYLGHREIFATASIGISLFPKNGKDALTLMKTADTAMYKAKAAGRNNYLFYSEGMSDTDSRRFSLETDLRYAVERNELVLHYQPQIDVHTGKIIGSEALVRWNHPKVGMIPPMEFIPLAEESGMIYAISEWVMYNACRQNKLWQEAGLPPIRIAVNISGHQFRRNTLVQDVKAVLEKTGLDPVYLDLEITENVLAEDAESARATFEELKQLGLRISIDDFGTGYSSLGYLKRFPLDSLKVDRCFVKDIPDDEDDVAICAAIIAMAHNLKLTVIAEGVEEQAQWDFLREQGCDALQGFLYSRPVVKDEFEELLRQNQKLKPVLKPVRNR